MLDLSVASSVLVGLCTVFAASLCFFLSYRAKQQEKKIGAIPMAFPNKKHFLIGHAGMLGKDMINGLKTLCVEESQVDGLSRFYLIDQLAIGVTKAQHVKLALNASNYRAKIPIIDKHIDMLLGPKALVSLMNEDWKILRKLIARSFNLEFLKGLVDDVNNVTSKFIASLSKKQNQVVDCWPAVKCITVDVIGLSAFNHNFDSCSSLIASPVVDAFEFMLESNTKRQFDKTLDPRYYFYEWPSSENKKYNHSVHVVRSTIDSIVKARRARRKDNLKDPHNDLLRHLLDAHEEDGIAADDSTLTDNLVTLLFGGFDTSSITLTYAFYLMATHPDVEAKVRKEVVGLLGNDRMPNYEEITTKLPYCTAVINEVLRLFPPAPVTVRTLSEPLTLPVDLSTHKDPSKRENRVEMVTLPKGVMMYIPIWWVHRSPDNYSNPDKFDPDRWLNGGSIDRHAHIPFSGGARDCVGRRFAMIEAVAVFALVVRKFSFETVPGYQLIPEAVGVVQKPKGGMPLKIHLVDSQ